MLISWKQLPLQYFFTMFYAIVTLMWQKFTGNAVIFPKRLDWNASDAIFDQCILWFIVFALVQTGCFAFVLLFSYLSSKFCCKKSVEIVTFREVDTQRMGSLKGHSDLNKKD